MRTNNFLTEDRLKEHNLGPLWAGCWPGGMPKVSKNKQRNV